MKNDLQNLTEDISRLYEDITQKAESLGQIDSITRLYDELQTQLQPTGRLPTFIGELIAGDMLDLKSFYADGPAVA